MKKIVIIGNGAFDAAVSATMARLLEERGCTVSLVSPEEAEQLPPPPSQAHLIEPIPLVETPRPTGQESRRERRKKERRKKR